MSYRAFLNNVINEAKSEKARGVILAKYGDKIEARLKSGTDAISKKYQGDAPGFLRWVESCDPTAKSIYTDWLLKLFLSGGFRYAEDIGKATDPLARYEELKPHLPVEHRDINYFKNFRFFDKFIDGHSETEATSNAARDRDIEKAFFSSGEAELYHNSPEIKVIIPKTMEAAQWFGRNTRWCTSAKSNNMFSYYNKDGPLYIILFKKTNTRWQFHFESDQYMDEQDDEINPNEFRSVSHLFQSQLEERISENGHLIQYIENPSEEIKMAAVRQTGWSIEYIDNPSEKIQIAAVQQDAYCIESIKNPSEAVQLAAVRQRGRAIEHIDNPSEAVQVAAIQKNGQAIQYIENPSEAIQVAAVQENGHVIAYIRNPSEAVKLAAVQQNGFAIAYIRNPSEAVKLAAVQENGHAISHIGNPSEAVQLAAVQKNGRAIADIRNPSEAVKLAAVQQNGRAISYIVNPSEAVKKAAGL